MTPSKTTHKNELSPQEVRSFRNTAYKEAKKHYRPFPWRNTANAYHILVSECMLQQTQAERVVEKYTAFIKKFPTVKKLADAQFKNVLALWVGLGYNRRALYLHRAAQEIVHKHKGRIPKMVESLTLLPGIGGATAAAILLFAHNKEALYLETNVRSVYLHHFFVNKTSIPDAKLELFIKQTFDTENPRKWATALLDYGVILKKLHKNPSKKSLHYTKQSKFKGSNRQLRGKIVKLLLKKPNCTAHAIAKELDEDYARVNDILGKLVKEGVVGKNCSSYKIR